MPMSFDRSSKTSKVQYKNQQLQACVSLNESKLNRLNKSNHYHDKASKLDSEIETDRSEQAKGLISHKNTAEKTYSTTTIATKIYKMDTRNKSRIDSNKLDRIAFKIDHKNKVKVASSSSSIVLFNDIKKRGLFTSGPTSSSLSSLTKSIAFLTPTILIIIFVLHNSIGLDRNQVNSLNCYHCSSVDNPDCGETLTGNANLTETDCEKHIGQSAKVCRKIVQYIEQKKVVIRSCGYIDSQEEKDRKNQCYKRSGTFAIMMQSCNCYTDLCNHSANLVPNHTISIILISCITLVTLLYPSLVGNSKLATSKQT